MNNINSNNLNKDAELKSWKSAVREAMRGATEMEALQRYGTKKPTFNYRWEHVTAVVTLALKLAELTGADRDVVEAAAWLHDVRKDTKDRHPIAGAKFARKFLSKTDFPAEKIELVAQAITDHMGLWRDEPLTLLESQVLWDADKLSKMGLTAVFHWTAGDLIKQKQLTTLDILKRGRANDWLEKTTVSMHTKPAQQAARHRLDAFNNLWDQLERELVGADLSTSG